MNDDMRNRLAKAMQSHEQKLADADQQRAGAMSEKQRFEQGWNRLRAEVVKPALEAIANHLRSNGHNAAVMERDRHGAAPGPDGYRDEVVLSVTPKGAAVGRSNPQFAFRGESGNQKVWFYGEGLKDDRIKGAFDLAEVSSDAVEEKTTEWLEALFNE